MFLSKKILFIKKKNRIKQALKNMVIMTGKLKVIPQKKKVHRSFYMLFKHEYLNVFNDSRLIKLILKLLKYTFSHKYSR